MKFTLNWLKDFLDTNATLEQILDALTTIGLEVESVIDRSKELAPFKVAHIVSVQKHPEADKLQVCVVNTGAEMLQIVCGAANARAGIKVVLAPVGTLIPNGNFEIKSSKIRGILSNGMMCSYDELLIDAADISGIIELEDSAIIGASATDYIGTNDPIIEVAITPNRGDCLSVYGIARDLAARGLGKLKSIEFTKPKYVGTTSVNPVIEADGCSKFIVQEIRGLTNGESPSYIQHYLKSVGVKTISAVVDVTNYVCLALGQPLHAYDRSKISDTLTAAYIDIEYEFMALNDKSYLLGAHELVIKDKHQVHALAGVIGGNNSKCDEYTSSIILEAAVFAPDDIIRAGRLHNVLSDSRHRFERSIDYEMCETAIAMAASLIVEFCGGEVSKPISVKTISPQDRVIGYNNRYLNEHIGMSVSDERIQSILTDLGFGASNDYVTIPSWRHDINVSEDISGEIARMIGYDQIPLVPISHDKSVIVANDEFARNAYIKTVMASLGYHELVTWSFMASAKLGDNAIRIANPINIDMDCLRRSIIPNMLETLSKNHARSLRDLAFFEVGPVFVSAKPGDQEQCLVALMSGNRVSKSNFAPERLVDVFDIKSDINCIVSKIGFDISKCKIVQEDANDRLYHPGRYAKLLIGKNIIGYFGEIHPVTLEEHGLSNVVAFELLIDRIPHQRKKSVLKPPPALSCYQVVVRDFAFIISRRQAIGEMISYVQNIDKSIVKAVNLFDIYQGEGIDDESQSIAFSVTIQSDDATMTDEQISTLSNAIVDGLESKFGASIRQ